jgi:BirA family transcriptional regulator, biotin operon repressor / biotin---[acetyl-CoA-carboxylase] ligase
VIADLVGLPARLATATRWLGHRLELLAETPSTNDVALRLGREGAPHGLTVIADTQSRGRGRLGHVWHSPPGDNLYVSVLLRLDLPPARVPPITLCAGVAVAELVNSFGVRASLKWPNDVLGQGDTGMKKISGILTEMSTRGGRAESVVVGVGLNVNTASFPAELPHAGSLRSLGGAPLDRAEVATRLLVGLEGVVERFAAGGLAELIGEWKAHSHTLGTQVRVRSESGHEEGLAVDLDDDGALLLERADGRRVRVVAGELES